MTDELELLRRERPAPQLPSGEARGAAERALRAAMASESRPGRNRRARARLRLGQLAPVAALAVVIAVALVFLGGHKRHSIGPAAGSGPELVFTAKAAGPAGRVNVGAVTRAARLLQQLTAGLPGEHGRVAVTSSGTQVIVHLGHASGVSRPELLSLVSVTGRLAFYDWEADTLTPRGRTVAGLLAGHDPTALLISQGGGSTAPGSPGAGSMPLYSAVKLASGQPELSSTANGRQGREYFAFGHPGSPACGAAARAYRVRYIRSAHCYLAGPTSTAGQALLSIPADVPSASVEVLAVPRGVVVLQAVPANFGRGPSISDPSAQFYVLRDEVGLFGSATTKPQPGTDASGSPDVAFGFTAKGAEAFQRMTAQIAHRGNLVSGLGETVNQHFAAALGDQLLTVPSIDFKTYPDGIPGNAGADITGAYSSRSVKLASQEMELGALPITLALTS